MSNSFTAWNAMKTGDKIAQKHQRSPLFDMNVFQYVNLSRIDFDIKFNVINLKRYLRCTIFEQLSACENIEPAPSDHPCFEEYTKPSL